LARLFERKEQFQRALEIYNELSRPNVMSVWSADAGVAREQLLARHPELAPTNVAAANSVSASLPAVADILRGLESGDRRKTSQDSRDCGRTRREQPGALALIFSN